MRAVFSCGKILSAVITRLVFSAHCLLAFVWIVQNQTWCIYYVALITGLILLLIESLYTIIARKGNEYKWFCPSVFCYLLTILPCIWVIELSLLSKRLHEEMINEDEIRNLTQQVSSRDTEDLGNDTTSGFDSLLHQLSIPAMEPTQMVVLIEQLLLFLLIMGRWMLPKGDISRDELSQLLLVYIGMAADIIEFFEAFKEREVRYNRTLILVILSIWSASLLQFTLVLTASKSVKKHAGFSSLDLHAESLEKDRPMKNDEEEEGCFDPEIFGIMTTVMLQDGPFLSLRLLMIFKYHVKSYMHIFFTIKNSLVLMLMVYRLFTICEVKFEKRREIPKKNYQDLDKESGHSSESKKTSTTTPSANEDTNLMP